MRALLIGVTLLGVALAAFMVGYAMSGTGSSADEDSDVVPLLEAIATSVDPATTPTVIPTTSFLDTLPLCDDEDVLVNELCLPVSSSPDRYPACRDIGYTPSREYAFPCRKEFELND